MGGVPAPLSPLLFMETHCEKGTGRRGGASNALFNGFRTQSDGVKIVIFFRRSFPYEERCGKKKRENKRTGQARVEAAQQKVDFFSAPPSSLSLSFPAQRGNCVQVFVCVSGVMVKCCCWFFFSFLSKKMGGLGERQDRKGKNSLSTSSPEPEQHIRHLVPPVEPGDLEGSEALAVPRGEGAVARGELFFCYFFFKFRSESFFFLSSSSFSASFLRTKKTSKTKKKTFFFS